MKHIALALAALAPVLIASCTGTSAGEGEGEGAAAEGEGVAGEGEGVAGEGEGVAGEGEGVAGEGEGEGEGEGVSSDLPTNCADAANAQNAACDANDPGPGSVGSGPAIQSDIGDAFGEGFVDGDVVTFLVHGDSQSGYGVLMTVDLTTGARTVLSGQYDDPANGITTVGTGPMWNEPLTLAKAATGFLVGSIEGVGSQSIFAVDAQGNRTLFLDLTTVSCDDGAGHALFPYTEMSVAADGTVFAMAQDATSNGAVVSLAADGTCAVLSYSGNAAASIAPVASGAAMDAIGGVDTADGKMWGLSFNQESLFSIDLATGQRTRVSSWDASHQVGNGDAVGTDFVRIGADGIGWATGGLGFDATLGRIDLATGDRTALIAATGPLTNTGGVEVTVFGEHGSDVVLGEPGALFLYDPASNDTNRVSR